MAQIAEAQRLEALRGYAVLDTAPEAVFDDLTRLAAQVCDVPMALVSLVDEDRQWFKSHLGLEVCSTSREVSFCAHTLERAQLLVVPDARLDVRFMDNELVTGAPWIRFYAGAPLVDEAGYVLGTLCVLDTVPRELTDVQVEQLRALARQTMAQLALRRSSAELAESRQLLDSLLEHSPAAIYAKDLNGRYLLGNSAFRSILGRGADLMGSSDFDLFPRSVAAQLQANDMAIAQTRARETFTEQVPLQRGGAVRDYISTKFPLYDAAGDVYAVAGVSTDITDIAAERRRHAEAEQRWRSLVDNSPVGISLISSDGVYVYANPRAVEVYGVSDWAAMRHRNAEEFIAPGREDETRQVFLGVLAGEAIQGWQWSLRQDSGAVIDVVISAARVSYDGAPAVMLQLRDISEQVAAQRALQESERSWRTLFGASPVGIGLSDEHGRFAAANAALCALLGRSEQEVLGHSSAEFTHPDDLGTHARARQLIEAAEDGVVRLEKRYVRPDGDVRWAWLTVTHVPGPTGQTWTLAHVQDVTDRKSAERAVADSEANLRAVASVVRHIQSGSDPRQTVVDAALDLAQATYASLVEPDGTPGDPFLRVTASTTEELLGHGTPLAAESFTATVFRTEQAQFLSDAHGSPLVAQPLLALTGARSLLAVPVRSATVVTGVLIVGWADPITDLDDRRASVVSLLADQAGVALRQAALVAELEALALTDALTGLPNRRSWDQHLAYLLAMSRRDGRPVTVALADLDHFKAFNDTRGHQAGDELLVEFADVTRRAMRASDTMARWGGEEFALSLPNCGPADAQVVLDRLRGLTPLGQTCSIGYATWDGVESAEALLARADQALYAAKSAGRNQTRAAT